MFLHLAGFLLMARLRGDHRHTPFFDARTGEPVATPRVLSEDELNEIERTRDQQ